MHVLFGWFAFCSCSGFEGVCFVVYCVFLQAGFFSLVAYRLLVVFCGLLLVVDGLLIVCVACGCCFCCC